MKKAIIQIRADQQAVLAEMTDSFKKAWKSGKADGAATTFTFSSPAQLFSVISPKRWELNEHLQKIGPVSVRGLARALGRDMKRVHGDVTLLMEWGIIERTGDGKIWVPFDVIHAGFDLKAVA